MKFQPIEIQDKLGRTIVLRNSEISDSTALIDYLKTTTSETPYLIREPDEVTITQLLLSINWKKALHPQIWDAGSFLWARYFEISMVERQL